MNPPSHTPDRKPPLHVRVAENLRQNVLARLQPGLKLDSEADLAQQLGVSVHTLRQAFSALAQEGLIERRHGSGTYVTDYRKQKAVAVCMMADAAQPPNSFKTRLFMLLTELFKRQGYRCRSYLTPFGAPDEWVELIEDLERGRIAGAVFVAMDSQTVPIPLRQHAVPYLQLDGSPGSVELDFAELVRTGARHLLDRGCRRIALMQWLGDTTHAREAQEAFEATLAEYHAPVRDEWMHRMVRPEAAGAGWEQFREIWAAREEKPDGLLVTDDVMFRDVAMAILDSRIQVPRQLQVVVHANKGSGATYPFPVSVLEVDLDEWAEAIVQRLIKRMKREPVSPAVQSIRARLIPNEEQPPAAVPAGRAPDLNVETTR